MTCTRERIASSFPEPRRSGSHSFSAMDAFVMAGCRNRTKARTT